MTFGQDNCFICNSSQLPLNGDESSSENELDIQQFRAALSLVCKLLNVSSESCKNEGDSWLKLEEESECIVPSICELCAGAFQEILRLQKVIEELKISQMVHVQTIRRSLLNFAVKNEDSCNSSLGTITRKKTKNYWKGIKNQLVTNILDKENSILSSSKTKRSAQPISGFSAKRTPGKPRHPVNCGSINSSLPSSASLYASLNLKTCTVQLSRLKSPSSINDDANVGGRPRHVRQSKLKAYAFLRKKSQQNQDEDSADSDSGDHHSNDNSERSGDDFKDPATLYPTHDIVVKKEHGDDWKEGDDFTEDIQDADWNLSDHSSDDKEIEVKHEKRKVTGKKKPKLRNSQLVYLITENTYLYQTTLIKYCNEEHRFTCQEPNCSSSIPGNLLDCSFLENIRSHVDQNHNSIKTSNGSFKRKGFKTVSKGIVRQCSFCPSKFSGPPAQLRAHVLNTHSDSRGSRKVYFETVFCEVCAKPCNIAYRPMHEWSHKSFEEKVFAIQEGHKLPNDFVKTLRTQKENPLYSLVFGNHSKDEDEEEELDFKSHIVPRISRKPITNYIYRITDTTLLYKFTLITTDNVGIKLTCKEPGCQEKFQKEPMDYYGLYSDMKNHIDSQHEKSLADYRTETEVKCHLCEKISQNLEQWRCHLLTDHRDKQYKLTRVICESCGASVHYKCNNFREHRQSHMGAEERKEANLSPNSMEIKKKSKVAKKANKLEVSCEICGRVFSRVQFLKEHSRVHVSKELREKWACPQCPKNFLSRVAVRNHVERIHQPDLKRTRHCPVSGCGRVFNKRDVTMFNAHMAKHKGETPFICEICGKGFIQKDKLKWHRELTHGEPGSHQCELCGKGYKNRFYLSRHVKRQHKN